MKTWAKVGLGCGCLLVLGAVALVVLSVWGARQYSDEYGYNFEREFGEGVFLGDRPKVRAAAEAAGVPAPAIEPATALRFPPVYSHDEFADNSEFVVEDMPLASGSPLRADLIFSFGGEQPTPESWQSLRLRIEAVQPDFPASADFPRFIVDGTAFALTPDYDLGDFAQDSMKIGDEWHSHVSTEIGPELAEWIGRGREVRLRWAGEELTLSDDAKATLLEFARLMR
ncbi:hypothetical protein AY599_16460 [Leptolyngbya valderiana BDU 20041]|nr:hypothetical protein AY599_16460 [Leptolyngbya valderiana BDU 20041]